MTITVCGTLIGCTQPKPENPFFTEFKTPFGAPPFEQIKPEHYMPAFDSGMVEEMKTVEQIIANTEAPTFENTILPLDKGSEILERVASVFYGQNSANTNDSIQAINRELAPKMSKHSDEIRMNPELFKKVKAVYDKRDSLGLDREQQRTVEEIYKGFVRGGANLSPEDQAKLKELNQQISQLQVAFGQNLLKETNGYKLVIDKQEDLAGLPESLVQTAAADAIATGDSGKWVFTLQNPSVMPFLQFADNRVLREQIYNAYIMRCNNNNENDNKEVVRQLTDLRMKKGQLMGYTNFANFVLEDRMAKNSENVYNLLNQLWLPALNVAKAEAKEMQEYINKEGSNIKLEGWDWRYYSEKVKKARFDLDENQVRPYFKLENVRDGIFYVCNRLYGITFKPVTNVPLPHPDAVAFECIDKDGTTSLGLLYMDFFPRASKRGGAWCGSYRGQSYKDGVRVAPIATVVCNFTKPSAEGQPALLSADEANTFFHEFGHALHVLFKDVHYDAVGGVPRDFVELPSQIMEHWCFEPEVLKVYAKHYQTGEVIPQELVDKIEKSGKFGQGFATTEYLAASILDMDFHVLESLPADFDVMKFESQAMNARGLITQIPPRYRTPYFQHTWTGGYTAGYYSYIWAEVLDCDAFQAFKETGDIFNPEVADKFRKMVLTPGGIEDAMDMYVNFRGSKPGIDALLDNRGLK